MRTLSLLTSLLFAALAFPSAARADDEKATSPRGKASPTPHHRKTSTAKHRYPANASPTGSPKKEPFQADADDEPEPSASPKPKTSRPGKASPKPKAEDDEAAGTTSDRSGDDANPPRKKKASPSASASASPKATPEEAASSTPLAEPTSTPGASPAKDPNSAENASLSPEDLQTFASQPAAVQRMLTAALELTRQDLTYIYGSSDPANGGMDCSGFIYHVLRQEGIQDVPRDASGQYVWLRKSNTFRAVVGLKDSTFELNELQPGDLLFWTGTYNSQKDPPVTHTMIYLGREKKSGQRVMVGSSDGRSYEGKRRWGVSVFDFKMPGKASVQKGVSFIGYARLPQLAKNASPTPSAEPTATAETEPEAESTPSPTPRRKKRPHRRTAE